MDAETRAFRAVNVLAVALVGLWVLARLVFGSIPPLATLLALALVALAILYLAVEDSPAQRAVGHWLHAPWKGPAGWKRRR